MQVQTFTPAYPKAKHRRYDQEQGQRIRIRHDILDAVEARCPQGMTLKAFINQTLSEHFL
jgi:hypothetical protein